MATVRHPRLPHITSDVPDGEVPKWLAQGWVGDAAPAPKPQPDKPKRPRAPRRKK